ncbi:MAG: hypothetical protein JRD93_20170 [Deltaproteobacteria bacterium]|nr:hypothetical protein [Deltaproteobacteria bacterium]
MGLREDFQSLQESWADFSSATKIFLCGTFLVSSMAIASIADATFKLRGFITTAIDFYRALTAPAMDWLRIHYEISQSHADAILLSAIFFASLARGGALANRTYDTVLGATYEWVFWTTTWLLSVPLLVSCPEHQLLQIGVGLLSFVVFIGYYKRARSIWFFNERVALMARHALLLMLAVFLFVAVVAAISEGLTRAAD